MGRLSPITGRSFLRRGIRMLLMLIPLTGNGSDWTVLGQDPGARPAGERLGELLLRFRSDPAEEPVSGTGDREDGDLPDQSITSTLTPSAGAGGSRRIDVPLSTPVCILGSDRISVRWLQRLREHLLKTGATCFLVSAAGTEDVNRIRKIAHPVPVVPLPFDDLVREHDLETLPVLLLGQRRGGEPE